VITEQHDGRVPDTKDELLQLPGVGEYTAAAILAFAYRKGELVLDTNVRRVLARVTAGQAFSAPALTSAERALAARLLPRDGPRAARWAVASMELGALTCTARAPRCQRCPISDLCRWHLGGSNEITNRRRYPGYHGTDRHCRGALLAAFRAADGPLQADVVAACWPNAEQRQRALDSLLLDGLVVGPDDDGYRLPG
jgi:A/G-specific adenine glycosylase